MSQQLLMWSLSPFLIQQLENDGLVAFEIFWNADEDLEIEEYIEDLEIELSDTSKRNFNLILNEAINSQDSGCIEIDGRFAELIHFLLTGEDCKTLTEKESLDFILREKAINDNSFLLANILRGTHEVRGAEDYVASYFNPPQVKDINNVLIKIGNEDFKIRYEAFSKSKLNLSNNELLEAIEFIKTELLSIYSHASDQKHGILIAWSI